MNSLVTSLHVISILFLRDIACRNYNCDEITLRTALEDRYMIVDTSANLLPGTWVSERCEIRTNSEHLLRSYTFHENNSYEFIHHYYWDSLCSSPKFSIIAKGTITLGDCPIEMFCHSGRIEPIQSLTVIPQDPNAIQPMKELILRKCPSLPLDEAPLMDVKSAFHIRQGSKQSKHYYETLACLKSFHAHFDELKFMRIQYRPVLKSIHEDPSLATHKTELLVGRVIGYYLVKSEKARTSSIILYNYTECLQAYIRMPWKIRNLSGNENLIGNWVSQRCEVNLRQGFFRRAYSFTSNTWIAYHYYYIDDQCMRQKLTVKKTGCYEVFPGQENSKSKYINISMTNLFVTVYDYETSVEMSENKTCGMERWMTAYPYNLTDNHGCSALGYKLPVIVRDLVTFTSVETDGVFLYVGHGKPDLEKQRRYVFQRPLIKCFTLLDFPEDEDGFVESSTRKSVYVRSFCPYLFIIFASMVC